MRDYDAERPRIKGTRTYDIPGGTSTTRGNLKPYNLLLEALGRASEKLVPQDKKPLQRLAWLLGEDGEVHACEVIMAHAKEVEYVATPWGYVPRV